MAQPHVPLSAIGDRYDGTVPTRGHGYQLHIGPMFSDSSRFGEDHVEPTPL